MKILILVKNLFLKAVRKIFPNGLKISQKTLIFGILVLVLCLSTFWTFSIYRANKSIDLLKSSDWQVREKATNDLARSGKAAVEPLIKALKDENWDIRWRAAYSLGNIGDSRAIEPLAEALKDEDRRVRYRAVEALGKIGDKRAVEPLNAILKDKEEDTNIRERAVRALGEIGKPAIESILVALKDEKWEIKRAALEALRRITGEDFGVDLDKWQQWWDENKDKFSTQK